ncbi:GNAT family N-acetyltransferase [Bradyrhizobium manausense]|uniref:GNAT family N-acetyltransferase n=1 Tax=Bradyrhizobium manausense TaxID=989370 RepID=UPI001BAE37D2|nr:GNAT family N-acetyltransferase [Bradyrhizobium manausense]MBR0687493.1 GNAT family N-acetyltransferase [Bradyrhizobium manausense]MBR0724661.1 GNAT family N-acetyltransferase [Bradyrhizobium manausense]
MTQSTISLTTLRDEHLEGALRLSRQAGWPHRLDDWQLALDLSMGFVALDSDAATVLGTVLMTPYAQDVATINMVIVDEAARGRGLGRQLMEAVIALAGPRKLRLIATREGAPLYQKLGFWQTGTIVQHQGQTRHVASPAKVRPAEAQDIVEIIELDKSAYGADRRDLLRALAKVGQLAVLDRGQGIIGFAGSRAFGRGEVIGPVVAANVDDGKALIEFFMARSEGRFVRVDTAEGSQLSAWLAHHGLTRVDEGIAMQRPNTARSCLGPLTTFALASQAFG